MGKEYKQSFQKISINDYENISDLTHRKEMQIKAKTLM